MAFSGINSSRSTTRPTKNLKIDGEAISKFFQIKLLGVIISNKLSNHQPRNCSITGLFRHKSKKTSKLCVTGLCTGNKPVTGEFPAQRVSNSETFPFDDVIIHKKGIGINIKAYRFFSTMLLYTHIWGKSVYMVRLMDRGPIAPS